MKTALTIVKPQTGYILLMVICLSSPVALSGENTLKGVVKRGGSGTPLIGVKVVCETLTKGEPCFANTKTIKGGQFQTLVLAACSSLRLRFSKGGYIPETREVTEVAGLRDLGIIELQPRPNPLAQMFRDIGKGVVQTAKFIDKSVEKTASAIYHTFTGKKRGNNEPTPQP